MAGSSEGVGDKELPPILEQRCILQSEALSQYIMETSVYPREPEALRELRQMTATDLRNVMATGPDEMQFLSMLLKLMNAKKTLEIGVFTGYSLLATALSLPHDGEIIAIDTNRKNFELGLPFFENAGVAHKVDFREGLALPILNELTKEEKYKGWFDFVFVDADKSNYMNYHERVVEMVRVGGIIGYDNTLWNGSVVAEAMAERPFPWYIMESRDAILEFNAYLAADSRVEICHLSIADGLTLCRRLR
ncbi:caffeoyl-CoA O-methyltransferase-like [Musa acuminata AAA Group]|uniref:caffeoyl-CoA O-methyltransferase-like n=1 Tax=Musa acuminata AAA Group TaxID=214697 RepID=UPI0031D438BE